jgi:hypothetical protein
MQEESRQALELPKGTLLLALTSIYWRESWEYGERAFRYSMHEDFVWESPSRTPRDIEFYLLALFEESLQKYGPWYYRRLFWGCGVIGQAFNLAG